jgi:hypothetical protein
VLGGVAGENYGGRDRPKEATMTTLTYRGELTVVTCWCGTAHAVPAELRDYQLRQHRDGQKFTVYCPLGHGYSPSGTPEVETVRRQLERAETRAASLVAHLDQEKASHAATKGQLTKVRKRAAKGVCPCCNRSFVNVARHVATKHPNFEP